MPDEKEIIETLENLAVDKYIDGRKLEEKDVEAIINIIVLYRQEKEKNKKARDMIEYYLIENNSLNDFDKRNKELRKLEKVLEE